MKRGQQRTIPAAGQQQQHHLLAAFALVTQEVLWTEAERKQTDSFLLFLEHFMQSIDPTKPAVLLATYHFRNRE